MRTETLHLRNRSVSLPRHRGTAGGIITGLQCVANPSAVLLSISSQECLLGAKYILNNFLNLYSSSLSEILEALKRSNQLTVSSALVRQSIDPSAGKHRNTDIWLDPRGLAWLKHSAKLLTSLSMCLLSASTSGDFPGCRIRVMNGVTGAFWGGISSNWTVTLIYSMLLTAASRWCPTPHLTPAFTFLVISYWYLPCTSFYGCTSPQCSTPHAHTLTQTHRKEPPHGQ